MVLIGFILLILFIVQKNREISGWNYVYIFHRINLQSVYFLPFLGYILYFVSFGLYLYYFFIKRNKK